MRTTLTLLFAFILVSAGLPLLCQQSGPAPTTHAGNAEPRIASIHFDPARVTSGDKVRLTIQLATPAPENGLTVELISSDVAAMRLPASVKIPAGATQLRMSVTTRPVTRACEFSLLAREASSNFSKPPSSSKSSREARLTILAIGDRPARPAAKTPLFPGAQPGPKAPREP